MPIPDVGISSIDVNPVFPDYFWVIKSNVVDKKFKIKNYVNQEDLENIQLTMNEILARGEYKKKKDVFELAIEEMRQKADFNIGGFSNSFVSFCLSSSLISLVFRRTWKHKERKSTRNQHEKDINFLRKHN